MIQLNPSLKTTLKRLKLSGILPTLLDRVAYAQKAKLSPLDFLELTLQDEVERRDNKNLENRLGRAGFQESCTLEEFDWDAAVTFDRQRVRDLFNLTFIDRCEDVILQGPVGVGKTFLATALGHAACRSKKRVTSLRSDNLLKLIHQSRADNSTEKVIRSLLTPDLLLIDDFGLRRLDAQQSSDFYEIIIERHKRSSTILTSNRAIEEWIPLFDDPILAQSALDRLAHNAHQITIEGDSYRNRQRPDQHRATINS
ncbi:MAG: IS21-like element helper ATPase IstB [Trueperaceae bacterium]